MDPEADADLIAKSELFAALLRDAAVSIQSATTWSAHELAIAKFNESRERPTTIVLKQSKRLAEPPTVSNTANVALSILPIEQTGEFSCLTMKPEDLKVFGTCPLAHVFEEFVEFLPQRLGDDAQNSLPWEEDLKVK